MSVRAALATTLSAAATAAIGYTGLAALGIARFARRQAGTPSTDAPPVTVLVPLHGAEPGLEANLRALALQQYPGPLQIVVGVHDGSDTALGIARRVAANVPTRIDVAIGEDRRARNPKIANVLSMMRYVRHETLVLVDSDIRVDADTLRSIVVPLADPSVGMVTALYTGLPEAGTASHLGAMFINEQFVPSAIVDAHAHPLRHGYGAMIALRRSVLDAIGGFEAVGTHLADDHWLGRLVAARGLRIVLSHRLVRTIVAERTIASLWNHELRWHRTIRSVQPAGYAGLFLTYPLPLALMTALVAPRRGAALFAAALAARYGLQGVVARVLHAPVDPWLVVPRDVLGFAIWLWGFAGHGVRWRGAALRVTTHDELAPERPAPPRSATTGRGPTQERRSAGVA